MKLKEVDRSAALTWSASPNRPGLLAAGTVAGAIDDTFMASAQLEIYDVDLADRSQNMKVLGKAQTNDRFHRLAWGSMGIDNGTYPLGMIAGGLADGSVNIWNPQIIMDGGDGALVARVEKHQGAVKGLEFNSQVPNLLASGAADSEIFILDLQNPTAPSVYSPGQKITNDPSEISCVGWNRKVQHILASSGSNGTSVVWDLKLKRPVISFSDPNNKVRNSSLAWNPDVATQIVIASEDDRFPVIQMWDLRNAFAPVKELHGHTKGILGVSWCPNDSGLLMSCGKDGRTLCWAPDTGEIISELPCSTNWNFDVQWSPRIPAVLATASFDSKVCVHSLQDSGSSPAEKEGGDAFSQINNANQQARAAVKRAPKWLKRPCGASFGFGGRLVSFTNTKNGDVNVGKVSIDNVVTEPQFIKRADDFEAAMTEGSDLIAFCDNKAQNSNAEDAHLWQLMKILFQKDARTQLLQHVGYNVDDLNAEIKQYLGTPAGQAATAEAAAPPKAAEPGAEAEADKPADAAAEGTEGTGNTVSELFGQDVDSKDEVSELFSSMGVSTPAIPTPSAMAADDGPEAALVRKSLLVGNFANAVDCCIHAGRMADALLLAAVGGTELWAKTQEIYLQRQGRSFMRILSAVVNNKLTDLIATSDLTSWKETLAILSTYGKSEDFPSLCDALADRLEKAGDVKAATICFMCAGNVDRTVDIWMRSANSGAGLSHAALQDLIEKCTIFRKATDHSSSSDTVGEKYCQYAELLASEGRLATAMRYIRKIDAGNTSVALLKDRIYRSLDARDQERFDAPTTPFAEDNVQAAPAAAQPVQQQQAASSWTNQQPVQQQQQQQPQAHNAYQQAAHQPAPQPTQQPYQAGAYQGQYQAPASNDRLAAQAPAQVATNSYGQTSPFPQQAAQQAVPAATAPAEAVPAGAPAPAVGLAPEHKPITDCLQRALDHCTAMPANAAPAQKRRLDDMAKRINTLFDKLGKRELAPNVCEQLLLLCQALSQGDPKRATDIQVQLTASDWSDNGYWLLGVKRLIEEVKKANPGQ